MQKKEIKGKEIKAVRYSEGVGRRKTAVARVRIGEGAKQSFEVNEHSLDEYFKTEGLRLTARKPLATEGITGKYYVSVRVRGGGIHAQADAVALGLSRALIVREAQMKPALKKAKLLTSDSRQKERRKFGLKKARKSPQWSKR